MKNLKDAVVSKIEDGRLTVDLGLGATLSAPATQLGAEAFGFLLAGMLEELGGHIAASMQSSSITWPEPGDGADQSVDYDAAIGRGMDAAADLHGELRQQQPPNRKGDTP